MGRKKSLETKELEQRIERYFEKCDEQNFGEKDAKKNSQALLIIRLTLRH